MSKKNKPKMVTIQVLKVWNEGRVLSVGDRIEVVLSRAKTMENRGYAIIINPEAPYVHPATKKEHQFREVGFDESKPLEAVVEKIEITKLDGEKEVVFEKGVDADLPVETRIPSLDELAFLNKGHLKALKGIKVYVLNDLSGWDVDGLAGIKGISRKTAIRLIDDYNQICNRDHHKDSDMEVKNK